MFQDSTYFGTPISHSCKMGPGEDRERDNRLGRFTPEYDLKDFVEAVEKLERASTQDVADELGCSYDLAYRRPKGAF